MERQRQTAGDEVLILASASPRRRDLLAKADVAFEVDPSGVDETRQSGEDPVAYARRIAGDKARDVAHRWPGRRLLAADTVVVVDGEPFGKPENGADARRMLRRLSGRAHEVVTAVFLLGPDGSVELDRAVRTTVAFRNLSDEEIEAYVETREPFGKAGAYAIQGGAGRFVARLEGSWSNVVGLPMEVVLPALGAPVR